MGRFAKRSLKYISLLAVYVIILCSCSSRNNTNDSSLILSTANCELVYQETMSPNKDYVTSNEDIVNYTIQVFQNEDYTVIVNATSNSAFFSETQYTIDYDTTLSSAEVNVEWTTLMGNPDFTEEDQLAVAHVSIYSNSEIFNESKINFTNQAIETITETIQQDKN